MRRPSPTPARRTPRPPGTAALARATFQAIDGARGAAACVLAGTRLLWTNAAFRRLFAIGARVRLDAPPLAALRKALQQASKRSARPSPGTARPFTACNGRALTLAVHAMPCPVAAGGTLLLLTETAPTTVNGLDTGLYDPTTGLPNDALFRDRLAQAFVTSNRRHRPFAVMAVMVDGLRPLRTARQRRLFHAALVGLSLRLLAGTRAADSVAHGTTDELFWLLLPEIDALDEAVTAGWRIVRALESPVPAGKHSLQLSARVGIATFPEHGRDPDTLLQAAARAVQARGAADASSVVVAPSEADDPAIHVALVHWSDTHAIGIPSLDAHHRRMSVLVNQLGRDLTTGAQREQLLDSLKRVTEYTQAHFADEERAMAAHGIPGAARHAHEHARLLEELRSLGRTFDAREVASTIRILQEWFYRHIDTADRALGKALRARGVTDVG